MANLNLTNSFNQTNNSFSIAAVNNGNALPSFTNSFILEPSSVAAAAAAAVAASSSSSSSSAFNTISLNSFQNGNNHLLSPGPSSGGLKSKQNNTSQQQHQQQRGMNASNTSPSASNQNLNLIGTTSSHHKNPNRNKKVKDLIQDLQHNCSSNNGGLTMSAQHQPQQHGLYSDYQNGGGYQQQQQYGGSNNGNYGAGNQFYKTETNTPVSIFHGLDSSNNLSNANQNTIIAELMASNSYIDELQHHHHGHHHKLNNVNHHSSSSPPSSSSHVTLNYLNNANANNCNNNTNTNELITLLSNTNSTIDLDNQSGNGANGSTAGNGSVYNSNLIHQHHGGQFASHHRGNSSGNGIVEHGAGLHHHLGSSEDDISSLSSNSSTNSHNMPLSAYAHHHHHHHHHHYHNGHGANNDALGTAEMVDNEPLGHHAHHHGQQQDDENLIIYNLLKNGLVHGSGNGVYEQSVGNGSVSSMEAKHSNDYINQLINGSNSAAGNNKLIIDSQQSDLISLIKTTTNTNGSHSNTTYATLQPANSEPSSGNGNANSSKLLLVKEEKYDPNYLINNENSANLIDQYLLNPNTNLVANGGASSSSSNNKQQIDLLNLNRTNQFIQSSQRSPNNGGSNNLASTPPLTSLSGAAANNNITATSLNKNNSNISPNGSSSLGLLTKDPANSMILMINTGEANALAAAAGQVLASAVDAVTNNQNVSSHNLHHGHHNTHSSDQSSTTSSSSASSSASSASSSSSNVMIHSPTNAQMEEINTKELAHRVSSELKRYSIPQAVFAQKVLNRSQGTLSDLLRNPKPWSKLKSGRETFRRMYKWLQEPENHRMSQLRLAVSNYLVQTKRKEDGLDGEDDSDEYNMNDDMLENESNINVSAGTDYNNNATNMTSHLNEYDDEYTCSDDTQSHSNRTPMHTHHHVNSAPQHHQMLTSPNSKQQQQMIQINQMLNESQMSIMHQQQQMMNGNSMLNQSMSGNQAKKPRLVFSDIQRRTLQAIFKETKRPSKEMQVTIAQQLGLEVATVSNFFMNARRRSMDKWRDQDDDNSNSSSLFK